MTRRRTRGSRLLRIALVGAAVVLLGRGCVRLQTHVQRFVGPADAPATVTVEDYPDLFSGRGWRVTVQFPPALRDRPFHLMWSGWTSHELRVADEVCIERNHDVANQDDLGVGDASPTFASHIVVLIDGRSFVHVRAHPTPQ